MGNLPWFYPNFGPFYVATTGNDSTGDGTSGNPWATIGKARDWIRTNKLNVVQTGDITVNVKAGTYAIATPINFGVADGGYNGFRVIYTSVDGPGLAILDGGVAVTGWTNVSGNTWKATIPGGSNCYTLYNNGVRARLARTPKLVVNNSFPMAKAPYFLSQNNGTSFTVLKYLNADFDPSAWPVGDIQPVIWDGKRDWMTSTHSVTAKDTTNKLITFGESSKFYTFPASGAESGGSRYFMQGPQALLADAGEFYVDRSGGFVYYVNVGSPTNMVCSKTTQIVTIIGDSTNTHVKNITFDGFAVRNTEALQTFRMGYPSDLAGTITGPGVYADTFYPYWLSVPTAALGAVTVLNADGVTLSRLHLSQIGTNGVYLGGYGRNLGVRDSLIEHLGLSGIVQEGTYGGNGNLIGGSAFYNNRVRFMGELAGHATGIQIGQSGGNTISYCDISDGPRHGTWLYGSFGAAITAFDIYTTGNVVDHVHYARLTQDSGDTAGCYIESLQNSAGAVVNVNTFSQIIVDGCNAHPSMIDTAPNGVMTDDNTWGQVFTNVQVLNTTGAQFRANNSGGHVFTNTSFLANGTPNGSFNSALMDTANIGVTSAFPY